MGNHLDKYKQRLLRNGSNSGEAYTNNTIAFIDNTFHASPTFRVLEVLSTEFPHITGMDARVVEVERMGSLREVLFRPHEGLNVGTYIKFDNDTWLISDVWGSIEANNFKAVVQKCNRKLRWKDKNNTVKDIDCIASATPLGSKSNQGRNDIEWNKYDVRLPLGQLFVYMECNDMTKAVKINQRFIFGSNVYEVFGIDDTTLVDKNGFGIIQLTVKITTKREEDDFLNQIAFNVYDDVATTPPVQNPNPNEGGSIW